MKYTITRRERHYPSAGMLKDGAPQTAEFEAILTPEQQSCLLHWALKQLALETAVINREVIPTKEQVASDLERFFARHSSTGERLPRRNHA